MIYILVQEAGATLGEMRIEALGPGSRPSSKDYSIEYAAESGGGWVDLKRRILYAFPDKYNTLALVNAALNLLEYEEMEMTDGDNPRHLARGQFATGPSLPCEASDSERHHRSPFWGEQPE